jgi:hypothetical protein
LGGVCARVFRVDGDVELCVGFTGKFEPAKVGTDGEDSTPGIDEDSEAY